MKITFTLFLLSLLSIAHAQHIKYSPPETGSGRSANYEIIGNVGGHLLIFINGETHAEIAVFDDDMNKLESVPANFLKMTSSQTDFFTYPDHFLLVFQYHLDSVYYCAMLMGDGNGHVLEGPTILDSAISSRHPINGRDHPMFIVLRSENKQWFMILKGVPSDNEGLQLEATLYDKDFQPQSHDRFTYTNQKKPGAFSEFILDNDGDLAFIHSLKSEESAPRVLQADLIYKPHDQDTLIMTPLSPTGVQLDDLKIRFDNANHRYILNSLYYRSESRDLTGLCSMIWDKRNLSLTSMALTPLSPDISAEARSDYSPPEQVLNYYFLRQVFPYADGSFMVLAELCHGFERSNTSEFVRIDRMQVKTTQLLSPENHLIPYEPKSRPGYWLTAGKLTGTTRMTTNGQTTEKLLAFILDPGGKARAVKVIHMKGNISTSLHLSSYQTFFLDKAIHVVYNERVKGREVPAGISIHGDGTAGSDPYFHDLNNNYVFLPRYGKQIGPTTCIIPCDDGISLRFARVDFK